MLLFIVGEMLTRTCQQLFDDPLDLLLRWEYDPYALCYNGDHVCMLPRCARAIETGFTTFTTRLCWGESLGYCLRGRLSLICLARRGFGLRILPSYMKCLQGNLETKNCTGAGTILNQRPISQLYLNRGSMHERSELGVNVAAVQPYSGLKTLKRYIMLGRRRLPTVLRETTVEGSSDYENALGILALQSFSWLIEFDKAWRSNPSAVKIADFMELYTHRSSRPLLMCEPSADGFGPDPWDLLAEIDHFNQRLFEDLQIAICRRLQIPLQRFGCKCHETCLFGLHRLVNRTARHE